MKEEIIHKLRAGWPKHPTRPIHDQSIVRAIKQSQEWLANRERERQTKQTKQTEGRDPAPF